LDITVRYGKNKINVKKNLFVLYSRK